MADGYSRLSNQELDELVRARQKESDASDKDCIRSVEKHARCALLPSPEKLDESIGSPGSDVTDTLEDFGRVKDWITRAQLLNSGISDTIEEQRQQLETCEFGPFILNAFNNAFAAMRNTASPELEELVFWYYAGHGLGKETAKKLCYSSTPCLSKVGLVANYNDAANEFVKKDREVQGGELYLHKVGFCDLYGLLKPWIAAVREESINAKGAKKKNKHLVIILDSCHSGIIAQELEDFKKQAQEIDQTLLDENSITIQAACGPDERTYGGYFTPCFVYLNDPANDGAGLLKKWKDEWGKMKEQEKTEYRSIDLPSPMVVTTRPQSQDVTMEVEVQNFKLTLFQDPGFFKFCSIKVYQHQDMELLKKGKRSCLGKCIHQLYKLCCCIQQAQDIPVLLGEERVLDRASARVFMSSRNFTVLDYKLKTLQTGPYARTPMGLFLLEDPSNPNYSVCAHIHFQKGNTNIHTRINLVHHKRPPMGCTLFIEDYHGLSPAQIARGQQKIRVCLDGNASILVQTCRQYVNSREPGRWEDDTRWDMTGLQLGVNGKFRLQERSAWEDRYLEYI